MFQRYIPNTVLSVTLLTSLASSETLAQNTSSSAHPIIDVGYPDFRQTVDINNDHLNDYCRFVGTAPKLYLSCQLGLKGGGFAPAPYGFNAPIGTDLGVVPRLIFPVGGVQPAFCRYTNLLAKLGRAVAPSPSALAAVAGKSDPKAEKDKVADGPAVAESSLAVQDFEGKRPTELIPALDASKILSCIQASSRGFDPSKEVYPNIGHGARKTALVKGSDGATIEVVYGDSTWIASVQDVKGRHLHLSGFTQKSSASGYISYLKLYSDEDDTGRPFTAQYLKKNPRGNIILDQFFQLTGGGYTSYSTVGSTNLSVDRPNAPNSGYTVIRSGITPGSLVFVYDGCSPADPKSENVPYVGTLKNDASIQWNGAQPPSLAGCTPPSTAKLGYFAEVFQFLGAKTREAIATGNASVDNKAFADLNSAEIQAIIGSLEEKLAQTSDPKMRQQYSDTITFYRWVQSTINTIGLGALGSTISAYMLANPATAVPYTGVAASTIGFLVVVNGVIEVAIKAADAADAKACLANMQATHETTPECKKLLMLQ